MPMNERRQFPRISLNVEINYKIIGQRESDFIKSQAINLGALGVRFLLENKVVVGSLLDIKFTMPDSEMIIIATGQVSWIRELKEDEKTIGKKFEAGIEFIGVNKEDKDFIQKYIIERMK